MAWIKTETDQFEEMLIGISGALGRTLPRAACSAYHEQFKQYDYKYVKQALEHVSRYAEKFPIPRQLHEDVRGFMPAHVRIELEQQERAARGEKIEPEYNPNDHQEERAMCALWLRELGEVIMTPRFDRWYRERVPELQRLMKKAVALDEQNRQPQRRIVNDRFGYMEG